MKYIREILIGVSIALCVSTVIGTCDAWQRLGRVEAQQQKDVDERKETREEMQALRAEIAQARRLLARLLGRMDAQNWTPATGREIVEP